MYIFWNRLLRVEVVLLKKLKVERKRMTKIKAQPELVLIRMNQAMMRSRKAEKTLLSSNDPKTSQHLNERWRHCGMFSLNIILSVIIFSTFVFCAHADAETADKRGTARKEERKDSEARQET